MGHFYLHGKVKPEALGQKDASEIRDSTRDIITHRIEGSRPRSLIEWQANRFAASVLIPKRTAKSAVEQAQQQLGVRRRGRIWLDHQPQNQRDFRLLLSHLSGLYRVSQSVVRYRLRELNLLEEDPRFLPRRAAVSLGSVLEDLFRELS